MALLSDLKDNFNEGTIDTTLWDNWGAGNCTVVSSQLNITTDASFAGGYFGMDSLGTTYDSTGSQAVVQLVSAGNQSLVSLDAIFYIQDAAKTGNEEAMMFVEHGTLILRRRNAATNSDTSIPYDSTAHKWFRIREQSGTFFMDTAPDGKSWTNQRNFSNPFTTKSQVCLSISAGTWQSEASSSTVIFDNVNILPATSSKNLLGVGQV